MKKKYYILLIFLNVSLLYRANICNKNKNFITELLKEMTINSYNMNSYLIDSILQNSPRCFNKFEIAEIYNKKAEKIFSLDNQSFLVFENLKKAITNDYYNAVLLEFSPAQFIKKQNIQNYNELEKLSDSIYFSKNHKKDIQLGFLIRYMVRKDQDIRIQYRNAELSNQIKLDSLNKEMSKIDKLNEILLEDIFLKKGYPGYNLVGGELSSAYLIFHHMSIDFQCKYIHLLNEAIINKQLYQDLRPLIDKVLYNKMKVTLYGTHYTNSEIVKDEDIINKYLQMLNLIQK